MPCHTLLLPGHLFYEKRKRGSFNGFQKGILFFVNRNIKSSWSLHHITRTSHCRIIITV